MSTKGTHHNYTFQEHNLPKPQHSGIIRRIFSVPEWHEWLLKHSSGTKLIFGLQRSPSVGSLSIHWTANSQPPFTSLVPLFPKTCHRLSLVHWGGRAERRVPSRRHGDMITQNGSHTEEAKAAGSFSCVTLSSSVDFIRAPHSSGPREDGIKEQWCGRSDELVPELTFQILRLMPS